MDSSDYLLSVIVPAFNEEKNIEAVCRGMIAMGKKHEVPCEILVFDDASRDATSAVVKKVQEEFPEIRLFRHSVNKGLGGNYWAGIANARGRYSIMVPGDNEVRCDSLEEVFKKIGTSDIMITYSANPESRSPSRQLISNLFTGGLNFLFGLKVRYYNGPSVIRTVLARQLNGTDSSFAYMAVLLVQLLKGGCSYQHLTFALQPRQYGKTKAFRFKNVVNVLSDVARLFWKVYFGSKRPKFSYCEPQEELEKVPFSAP